MKLKELVAISWLVMWSGVGPGDGTTTTTTPIPSVVELAPPPEGAVPVRTKNNELKQELTAIFPTFLGL